MKKYSVLGMMSGTSMDGMDLCLCSFTFSDQKWLWKIEKAITLDYSEDWRSKLENAPQLSSSELLILHSEYGKWIGKMIVQHFKNEKIDFISSHGHTIFHQPQNSLTFQLGHGQAIASEAGLTTVCDFRTADVLLGGNGAPLVPVGDKLLFSDYKACVNMGGFANISFSENSTMVAFDICPANIVLNERSEKLGQNFDRDGMLAREGSLDKELLEKLNSLDFYGKKPPKSLGREWVEEKIYPLLRESNAAVKDQLRTYTEHCAFQTAKSLDRFAAQDEILFTGGGVYNSFLKERIMHFSKPKITIPDDELVNYKEALIFAFLAVLRMEKQVNVFNSVTGASRSTCSGLVFKAQ